MIQDLVEVDLPKQPEPVATPVAVKTESVQPAPKIAPGPKTLPKEPAFAQLPYAKPEPRADDVKNKMGGTGVVNVPPSIKALKQKADTFANTATKGARANAPETWQFDRPNPWSQIVHNPSDEYPYYFHIKLKVPSLNDFQAWKSVVPNIGFDPMAGEIIIPSKDEASALALANLIAINFSGMMTLDNILDKKLIQISVAKAKTHEMVQTKFREQINSIIYGKSQNNSSNFEKDLANPNKPTSAQAEKFESLESTAESVDFESETFKDTFQHFSDTNNNNVGEPDGYDGGDYSYL